MSKREKFLFQVFFWTVLFGLFIQNIYAADFTVDEKVVLKAQAQKTILTKQREDLGELMNAEIQVEYNKSSQAAVAIRAIYEPQMIDIDNQIGNIGIGITSP